MLGSLLLYFLVSVSLLMAQDIDSDKFKASKVTGGYTKLDQEFSNEYKSVISGSLNNNSNNTEIYNNSSQKIQTELSTGLDQELQNDTYNSKEFSQNIDSTYVDVFKEEATNYIKNDDQLSDEQKSSTINEMMQKDDLTSLSDFFKNLKLLVESEDGSSETWDTTELSDTSESLEESNEETSYSFDCECSDVLEDAYEKMYEHIITDNLKEIPGAVNKIKQELEKQIEETENQTDSIIANKKIYIVKLLEAKEYLFEVQKEFTQLQDKSSLSNE